MSDGIGVAAHEPALLFHVRNTELHGYIQRYPLLTGPDETLNRKCFSALTSSIECRESRQHHALASLTPEQLTDEPAIRAAAAGILHAIDLPAADSEKSLESRAWKMCMRHQLKACCYQLLRCFRAKPVLFKKLILN
jgi:hypothetical protein